MFTVIGVAATIVGVVTLVDYVHNKNNMREAYKDIGNSVSNVGKKAYSKTKEIINDLSEKRKRKVVDDNLGNLAEDEK